MKATPVNPGAYLRAVGARRGFTLIELAVVVAIFAVLLSLLLPTLRGTIGAARSFKCQMSERSVAFDFSVFADDELHGSRGDDETLAGGRAFHLETFIDAQFGINEFWAYPGEVLHRMPDNTGRDPMRCVEVKGPIELRQNEPCTSGGVAPFENISYGFNIRLHRSGGGAPVLLSASNLFENARVSPGVVPLLWDVDGRVAASRDRNALFSGPTLDDPIFAGDSYWFPGMRHNGAVNAAFLDGHVATSRRPLSEAMWAWGFEPGR